VKQLTTSRLALPETPCPFHGNRRDVEEYIGAFFADCL